MEPAKKERNRELYELRESGISFKELGERYGVTANCASSIYKKEKEKVERQTQPLYRMIESICDEEGICTRTYHVLIRNDLYTEEAILNVTRKQLQKCRNCGDVIIDIILMMQEKIKNGESI